MRRFIAGAACPKCQQSDSLYFDTQEAEDKVHCTRCDYSEIRATEISTPFDDIAEIEKEVEDKNIKWH